MRDESTHPPKYNNVLSYNQENREMSFWLPCNYWVYVYLS